jgi:molybdopterin-binding protein
MIPLNTTTDTLEAFASGACTDRIIVIYYDIPNATKTDNAEYRRGKQITALNGATDVTICSAPPRDTTRHIDEIIFCPSATIGITIQYDENGTETLITSAISVTAAETLHYGRNGFQILS